MTGDQPTTRPYPLPAYQRLAERAGVVHRTTMSTSGAPVAPTVHAVPTAPAPNGPNQAVCVCGRVCVCAVPAGVVRSVASFVAEWHPTAVLDPDPAAERAEDASPCRCGQTFCGYRIFARTMRRSGAYARA